MTWLVISITLLALSLLVGFVALRATIHVVREVKTTSEANTIMIQELMRSMAKRGFPTNEVAERVKAQLDNVQYRK